MPIRIDLVDDSTNTYIKGITIPDEDLKALAYDMIDEEPDAIFGEWILNAIIVKSGQCRDMICKLALEDEDDVIVTTPEKLQISAQLQARGIRVATMNRIPTDVKRMIVDKARVKSAKERRAESDPDGE